MAGKRLTIILLVGCALTFFSVSAAEADQIHQVQAGESLARIATEYGTDTDQLMELNRFMEDPDRIFSGQVLVVPVVEETPEVEEEQTSGEPAADSEQEPKETEDQAVDTETAPAIQPPPRLTTAQLMKRYRSSFLHTGPLDAKKVALTFDDGPDARYTPMILDVLREHGVPATFFLVGGQIEQYPTVVNRIYAEEHVIASHSWSHPNFMELKPEDALLEIHRTERAVFALTGKLPALFRAPWGKVTEDNLKMLVALGYKKIYWSADSQDWNHAEPDDVLVSTLSDTRRGSIILMHSAGGRNQNLDATVAALPDLIYTLQVHGYQFVTVDELLSIPAYR